MNNDDLEKLFFDSFADEDDVFTDEWVKNYGSSEKSVGEFGLWKISKCMK